MPGSGNSSPIVWGDRIFLTTGRTGGRQLSILAYRRSDGALLWETDVAPGGREYVHPKNGPAAATPVTDGERVYASFGSRGLVAVDFDGNRLWHAEVGQIDNYHGPAGIAAPLPRPDHSLPGPAAARLRRRLRHRDRGRGVAHGA